MIGRTLNHYRIISKLGEGGMGEVYLAEDANLKRRVALKVLPRELAGRQELLERFQREAEAVAALNHPNIVTIYSVEEAEGIRFLTMEYIDGKPLAQLISPSGMTVDRFLELAIPLTDALRAAHQRGIIHRDLKPANIMVDSEGRVKVLDFGLAKLRREATDLDSSQLRTETMTSEGQLQGTIPYMSPEQVEERTVDPRSDLFSLGTLFYEMLSGQRPFTGRSLASLISSILRDSPPAIATRTPGIPSELDDVLRRLLEKDPGARHQTAEEVREDLEAVQDDMISAHGKRPQASLLYRASSAKWWLGYLGVAALTVVVVVVYLALSNRSAAPRLSSLAVLPLQNLSADPEQEYLADGMTEALITDLARIGALKVISRTSVMQYKERMKPLPEIAEELDVEGVVTGSVLRSGGRIRITAQLIDATTEEHLWADRYERDVRDVLALQSEVVEAIAREIRITLTPQEAAKLSRTRAVDPEAHEAHMRGLYFFNKFELFKAVSYFEEAIAADHGYAQAHAMLAACYTTLGNFGQLPPREAFAKAKTIVERALELDEGLAEAHAARAHTIIVYDWDWGEAERALERALQLNPGHWFANALYGFFLTGQGRFDEGIAAYEHALEVDPIGVASGSVLGWALWIAGRNEEAIEVSLATLELDPKSCDASHNMGLSYAAQGLFEQAIANHESVLANCPDMPRYLAAAGHTLALAGHRADAEELLNRLEGIGAERYVSSYDMAILLTGLGRWEAAFARLERALAERDGWLSGHIKVDPRLDPLRDDSRFEKILQRMNLSN
jgi:serine/threonine-protein kinase